MHNKQQEFKPKSPFEQALYHYTREFYEDTYKKEQLERFQKQLGSHEPNERDNKLWEKFRNIVIKHKQDHPNEITYFNFDFVDMLGLNPDMIFIYAGKNIGKTYALSRLATKTILESKENKVFYLRNLRDHLLKGFKAQNAEDNWPWDWCATSGELTLKKGHWVQKQSNRPKQDLVGWATYLSGDGTRSFQGSGFEGLRYLMWDECNDIGDLTQDMLNAFLIFCVSLERNNPDFKIIMTGNLLSKGSGIAGNSILDMLGIPIETKLKYVEIENDLFPEKKFKFLYINTGQPGELFDGSETQKFNALFKLTLRNSLIDNQPKDISFKVVNTSEFLKGTPLWSFVVPLKNESYVCYICSKVIGNGPFQRTYYIVKVEPYDSDYHIWGYKLLSDDIHTCNLFGKVTRVHTNKLLQIFIRLTRIIERRRLFFANSDSRIWFNEVIYPHLQQKFAREFKNRNIVF